METEKRHGVLVTVWSRPDLQTKAAVAVDLINRTLSSRKTSFSADWTLSIE